MWCWKVDGLVIGAIWNDGMLLTEQKSRIYLLLFKPVESSFPGLRRSATDMFLLNLSITDLINTLFNSTFNFIYMKNK